MVAGTAAAEKALTARPVDASAIRPAGKGLEIVFRADPTVYDGRFANNGWLQELPKPHTKLTWDNAALLSPATATKLGVKPEQVVEIGYRGRQLRAPVWVLPGQAPGTITLHLGYGRTRAGRVGNGAGFNAYAVRTTAAPWSDHGVSVRTTGERYALATTQNQQTMEGRAIVRSAALEEFKEIPTSPITRSRRRRSR